MQRRRLKSLASRSSWTIRYVLTCGRTGRTTEAKKSDRFIVFDFVFSNWAPPREFLFFVFPPALSRRWTALTSLSRHTYAHARPSCVFLFAQEVALRACRLPQAESIFVELHDFLVAEGALAREKHTKNNIDTRVHLDIV